MSQRERGEENKIYAKRRKLNDGSDNNKMELVALVPIQEHSSHIYKIPVDL